MALDVFIQYYCFDFGSYVGNKKQAKVMVKLPYYSKTKKPLTLNTKIQSPRVR